MEQTYRTNKPFKIIQKKSKLAVSKNIDKILKKPKIKDFL